MRVCVAMANPLLFILKLFSTIISSFIPSASEGYYVAAVVKSSESEVWAFLEPIKVGNDYGVDIPFLIFSARIEKEDRIRVRITDANNSRWEVPQTLLPRPPETCSLPMIWGPTKLKFSYTSNPFGFAISRRDSGEVLFNSTPSAESTFRPLVFKNQYLEISTSLPGDSAIYGFGESTRPDGLRLSPGRTYTLWNTDIGSMFTDTALYGAFPYYMDRRKGGATHSVLLMNSNGMDIDYGGHFLTYKIIGGILDFYFFAGPSPADALDQYTQLVGRPAAMPYWTLGTPSLKNSTTLLGGFHQCRWGYKNVEEMQEVVSKYSAANIPLEAIWSDIDHMDNFRDFTLDPDNYPAEKLVPFVQKLHADGQHYVIVLDPCIHVDDNYVPYSRGLEQDIFLKESNGTNYHGQVWPGLVHFPDFLHPKIGDFWTTEILEFHKTVAFDGLWLDMNEPANFCTGSYCYISSPLPRDTVDEISACHLECAVTTGSLLETPPYMLKTPNIRGPLQYRTAGVTARHAGGELEYDAHNLYGHSETMATYDALLHLKKRPFVLGRSGFPGTGKYAAHWTGDNGASWKDMRFSVVSVLNSGLFGMPMVGADICGFNNNTTEQLCARWIQLGAFYPFARNHYDIRVIQHELYIWDSVASNSRSVLDLRYRLLPYFYTLVYEAHMTGAPMARPLFYEYPSDSNTLNINDQFLLGKWILVSPVLYENITSVGAYFPTGSWYNLFDYSEIRGTGSNQTLAAPLDTINVHVAQGSIIPMQDAAMTTAEARRSKFSLLLTFSSTSDECEASGELFLDDGVRVEMKLEPEHSTFIKFSASKSGAQVWIESEVTHGEFALKFLDPPWRLQTIIFLGLKTSPSASTIVINNRPKPSSVEVVEERSSFKISNLNLLLGENFSISW